MKTFSQALLEHIESNSISLRKVALGAGVSYDQLKKIKQNPSIKTNVDDAIKISEFLGTTVNEMVRASPGSAQSRLVDALQNLDPAVRKSLLDAANEDAASEAGAVQLNASER